MSAAVSRRPGHAGGAAADGVHHNHRGARLREDLIDLFGRGEGLDAYRGEFLPERFNGLGIVNGR